MELFRLTLAFALTRVLTEYPEARSHPFAGHPIGAVLRRSLPEEVEAALGPGAAVGLKVRGSAGQGLWAAVPWVSVFDRAVTETAMAGYYPVYLFHARDAVVHLSLNQGATASRAEFGRGASAMLGDRARLMRRRLPEFLPYLPVEVITLGSDAQLPGDYEAGHAMGVTYRLDAMPPEEVLWRDLAVVVQAYRTLTFRGGLDATPELAGELSDGSPRERLTEVRRYALHRRIERHSRASVLAKKHHGHRCQACDLDFEERYGPIGRGFIEAHHLRPLSSLQEGEAIDYDVADDFAVLCANCHRMIHRPGAPPDLEDFRELVRARP